MYPSKWTRRVRIAALLSMTVVLSACNGDGDSRPGGAKGGESMAVTLPKKYNVAPGADPSVPAEMGGAGFEAIAAAQGWQTSTLSAEQLEFVTDTTAKKGGRITLAINEYPATFRSYGKDENTQETRAVHGMVYESLLGTNPLTLDFLPSLATHWKVGEDQQSYTFRIDPNARFSYGHPVTSDDVVATWKLAVDSTILSPSTNASFSEFEQPVAVSKYIVSVKSKTKNWKNMLYFAGMEILPAHVISTINGKQYLDQYQYEMPPGSGPYAVMSADIKKGNSVALTRRADWWAKDNPTNRGTYNFDKIVMTVVRDERLQLERFKKGETDFYLISRASYWVEEFDPKKDDLLKRGLILKKKVFNANPAGFQGLAFNTRRAPFNDVKVRQAFALLFNRKQIIEKLMYNQYEPTYSFYAASPYENPSNPRVEYDPTKAAQLLTEAGYSQRNAEGILTKNGQPLTIEMLIYQQQERFLTPVQQDFKQAGIKLNLRTMDNTTWFTMLTEGNYQLAMMGWGGLLYPNPKTSFHSSLATNLPSNNITGFKNAMADELIERERLTFDPTARVQILQQLDGILAQEYHYAFAWHAPYVRLVWWNKFGMPKFTISRINDWRDVLGSWWFDPEKDQKLREARSDKSIKIQDPLPEEDRFWQEYDKTHKPQLKGSVSDTAGSTPTIR
jgi:microcin C transport system substrate-binding protein